MISLKDKINEELIFERVVSFIDDFKFTIDIIPHAEDRETRHNKNYISKVDIVLSLGKVSKDIRNDLNTNFIKLNDRIQIIDKSRDDTLNILCDILKDNKKNDYIKLSVVTVMLGEMPTYDIKKIYTTYSNDSRVRNDVKILRNEI